MMSSLGTDMSLNMVVAHKHTMAHMGASVICSPDGERRHSKVVELRYCVYNRGIFIDATQLDTYLCISPRMPMLLLLIYKPCMASYTKIQNPRNYGSKI